MFPAPNCTAVFTIRSPRAGRLGLRFRAFRNNTDEPEWFAAHIHPLVLFASGNENRNARLQGELERLPARLSSNYLSMSVNNEHLVLMRVMTCTAFPSGRYKYHVIILKIDIFVKLYYDFDWGIP